MNDDAPDVLFDANFLPGPDALFAALAAELSWDERMYARKTASFGAPYDYSQLTYAPTPMHPLLLPVVARLAARLGHRYNNCLVNLYEEGGNTMGFHVDDLRGLVAEAGVAIVSLGAPRTLVFQRVSDKSRTAARRLTAGSLLWMPPAVQHAWKHGVPAEAGAGTRISLTFRAVAPP